MKTIAMRPVILNDYQVNFFIAMEIKIFDGYKSNAHHIHEGWDKYLLIQADDDVAKLCGLTHQQYKNIALKNGHVDEHNLLIFDGRKAANELACILWSKQIPPIFIDIENNISQYNLIEKIAEARVPFDK